MFRHFFYKFVLRFCRAGDDFVEKTCTLAEFLGLKSSDYIREAVQEKNEKIMAERIAMLSRTLSAKHLAFNESVENTISGRDVELN